jgi:hypothetical protein
MSVVTNMMVTELQSTASAAIHDMAVVQNPIPQLRSAGARCVHVTSSYACPPKHQLAALARRGGAPSQVGAFGTVGGTYLDADFEGQEEAHDEWQQRRERRATAAGAARKPLSAPPKATASRQAKQMAPYEGVRQVRGRAGRGRAREEREEDEEVELAPVLPAAQREWLQLQLLQHAGLRVPALAPRQQRASQSAAPGLWARPTRLFPTRRPLNRPSILLTRFSKIACTPAHDIRAAYAVA